MCNFCSCTKSTCRTWEHKQDQEEYLKDLVDVKDSAIAGQGLFLKQAVKAGFCFGNIIGSRLSFSEMNRRYNRSRPARYVAGPFYDADSEQDFYIDQSDGKTSSNHRYLNHAGNDAANIQLLSVLEDFTISIR